MDVIQIAKEIEKKIKLLESARGLLGGLAADKANAMANYDKNLAITIIKLRNGKAFVVDEETIKEPPTTLVEKIAKGICWESKLQADHAEAEYKLALSKLESVKAELNGYQSIYRHLDES